MAGFRVGAVAASSPAPAHWSRSCHDTLRLPHPLEDPDAFVAGIERAVSRDEHGALIPGSDCSLMTLSSARERLEPHVRMGLPPHDAVVASLNKLALAEAAVKAGLAAPETAVCSTVQDALSAADRMGFPVALKPASSLIEVEGVRKRVGSVMVDDPQRLAALAPTYGVPCLIERAVRGSLVSFAGVFADGRLLATAVSRYVRTWHPEGGNVCFSVTIAPDPALSEQVVALLGSLRWQGIFELELMERPDCGHTALDLNPRFYGSVGLAIAAGADVPAIWCEWLLGRDPSPSTARAGVRYRWEDADLRHALKVVRAGKPGKAAAILRPHSGTTHPYFASNDPGPLVARAIELGRLVIQREPERRDRPRGRRKPDEVAVIGAGPYGLATAAHLRHAGVPVRKFGGVLEFWREQMPEGMRLRSRKRSTHISDPERKLTIDDYVAATGRTVTTPSLMLDEFLDYGAWFQQQAVPDVDPRKVRVLDRHDGAFRLELEDGERVTVDRVVVAAGLFPFGRRPEPFRSLPPALVSHSADVRDLSRFAERKVLVVGGGQSALESAALLHEAGSEVDVLVREPFVRWLSEGAWRHRVQPVKGLLYAPPDVGPALVSHLVARPGLYRRMSRERQDALAIRSVRPAGAGWLRPRLAEVRIRPGVEVAETRRHGDDVRLRLGDGGEQTVDHVLLATGYRVDLSNYRFLPPGLTGAIACVGGYPVLSDAFETSVPGLHVLGAPAAWSFGPLMRFVAGSGFAARSLARGVTR
jgi:predicted ATP-grasp superfamily ATP-dependent carboligase